MGLFFILFIILGIAVSPAFFWLAGIIALIVLVAELAS